MEFVKEKNAFRHYNVACEMDAEITFIPEEDGVINANHTFVDPSLRGQGIARQLVDCLAEYARVEQLKIRATCPYIVNLFEKSTEYTDVKI